MNYDVIIPIATKDAFFIHRTIKYIRMNLKEAEDIYIISNRKNFRLLHSVTKQNSQVILLDENELLEGLTFSSVKEVLMKYGAAKITGWYFQQFLKLGFAKSKYAKTYYLSWDADTIPLGNICFEQDGKLIFDVKKEFHKPYFVPIKNILHLDKVIESSFIAEHMLFDVNVVKHMLADIENNKEVKGTVWWSKILNACDYSESLNAFSEFETYGTYAYNKNPNNYEFRQLSTFRRGGLISGRFISDKLIDKLGFDLDTVSFELNDTPPFPLSLIHILYRFKIYLYAQFLK